MITGEIKNQINKLWTEFWTGGITNPLTVVEQISFLMFSRLLDIMETRNENKEKRTGKPVRKIFRKDEQDLRWSNFRNDDGTKLLEKIRDKVFPHFKKVSIDSSQFGEYMKDAQLMIVKPSLLVSAVTMIHNLPLTDGDTKGDLYEFLLSKLTTAGINGQFRTPRHIIRFMTEVLEPKPNEIVGDPACGTGGFLVGAMEYLLSTNTSSEAAKEHPHLGDQLNDEQWKHIKTNMFYGYDFDATMLRTAAMNLILHGVEAPEIHYQDTMSGNFVERHSSQAHDYFDVILANPPFKGSLDFDDVSNTLLSKVKTKKTELLFVALILRMLKNGGRSATIVPVGVLFGSSKAHIALRKLLIEENQLEAVISLPSGVFKPYAGVSTAILVFRKNGITRDVFFYDVKSDGFSLDDKREPRPEQDDLKNALNHWKNRNTETDTDRKMEYFFIPISEIIDNKYDLSFNRYNTTICEEEDFAPPKEILEKMTLLESEIKKDLDELEGMLK